MVMVKNRVAVTQPGALVWIVNEYVPGAVGVPEMTPVDGLRVKPGGREPEITEKVTDETGVEPVTTICWQ